VLIIDQAEQLFRDTWLADTRADRLVRAHLRAVAQERAGASRDPSYLYSGNLLGAATTAAARLDANAGRGYSPGDGRFTAAGSASSRTMPTNCDGSAGGPRSGSPELRTNDPYRRRLPHRWPFDAAGPRTSYRNVGTLMLREQHRRANVVPAGGWATATESQRCCCPGNTSLLSGAPEEAAGGFTPPTRPLSRPSRPGASA
jgi:hypothetical protein